MLPTQSNDGKPSILKNTRESKGLTLEIVHEATKIPMDVLRAIEEGYSVRILSPFYYRGFIKIYAEFLGLDVAEIYKQYGLDQQPSKPAPSVTPPKSSRVESRPNVILEQAQEWFSLLLKPKNLKLMLKGIGFLVLLLLLFKMGGCIAAHMHKKEVPSRRQPVYFDQEKRTQEPQATQEEQAVVPPPEVKHEVVQVQSEDRKVEVAVRASKDTWLRVKADDKLVFEMTLKKGSMESWSADNHIELSGRNIELLDMEVNEKHIGFLGGGERRIRKVLITKEGLTVKK